MAAEERITPIGELRPGLKNVHCIFIVIDKGTQQKTKDGSIVRKCKVADRTGSIIFSVWNDEAEAVTTGDIIKLTKGYSSVWKGCLVLYCGKYGIVEKLGEFTMVFSETPDMSVPIEVSSTPTGRQASSTDSNGTGTNSSLMGNHNENNHSSVVPPFSDPPTSYDVHPNSGKPQPHHQHREMHITNGHTDRRPHSHDNHMHPANRHHPYSRQNTREEWR